MKRLKINKSGGITLVSLVVTIVVLLILAGISIAMLTGDNGILTKAREAKEETQIVAYKEALEIIGLGLETERIDESEFLDRYVKEIKADEMFKDAKKVEKVSDTKIEVITKEGYIFEVTRDNVEYKGKDDGSVPEEPEEPEIEIPELQEGDITFSYNPSEPTNGSVKVTIETKLELEDSWIEYSTDGSYWIEYKNPITVTNNCEIYARISNSAGSSVNTATGNVENIDRLKPKIFTPTASNTTNSITLTGSTEDEEATETDGCSGIDVYYFSIDGGATWEPDNGQEGTSYTFSGLVQGKEYKLKMKAVDKAGNEIETEEIKCTTGSIPDLVKDQNVTFTYSPTTFTRGNVTVTIETNVNRYTLQYSTNGTSWQNYSMPITMEKNGTVYAKLVDNSGQEGGSASANITIIDKLEPNNLTLGVTGVTENSITVVANAEDQAQTEEYASSGIKGYQFSINNGAWEPAMPQASGTYTFNNLTANTSYSIKVKAIDNANNEKEITNAITGTTEKGIEIVPATSQVANYADTDGDGTADGIIFADLAVGGSGTCLGESYSIPTASGLKEYYVENEDYRDSIFGNKKGNLIAPVKETSGTDRFYIMALEDVNQHAQYSWYYEAGGNMTDIFSTTSVLFGKGKTNTENMIKKWNNNAYGPQNDNDMWGAIQAQVNQGWFVPSRAEWVAFAGNLGITENNYGSYGLVNWYWSSSQDDEYSVYYVHFSVDRIMVRRYAEQLFICASVYNLLIL